MEERRNEENNENRGNDSRKERGNRTNRTEIQNPQAYRSAGIVTSEQREGREL